MIMVPPAASFYFNLSVELTLDRSSSHETRCSTNDHDACYSFASLTAVLLPAEVAAPMLLHHLVPVLSHKRWRGQRVHVKQGFQHAAKIS